MKTLEYRAYSEFSQRSQAGCIGALKCEIIFARALTGTGKPEPLKHELTGCWSRRIEQEHRRIYQVKKDKIRILVCRYHY